MDYKQKYLKMLRDQKGGEPFLSDILALPAYSWLFMKNQRQLQLIFTGRSISPIPPLVNIRLNPQHRLSLLAKGSLPLYLAFRLVGPGNQRLAKRIMSRTIHPSISKPTCVATLTEHRKWVNSVAFHPTAPFLATGSNDMTAKLWRLVDTVDGTRARCEVTLRGHSESVNSVAFHPTAPFLATGSYDNTAKVWQLDLSYGVTATCVATLDQNNGGHNESVNSVAFHPTAPFLATGSNDDTAKVWRLVDTANGMIATCVATLDQNNGGHSGGVRSVAFHTSLPLLATSSHDHTAKVWRLVDTAATCVATLTGHNSSVHSVAFHPTAPLMATGSSDSTVKMWRLVDTADGMVAICVATLDQNNGGHSSVVNSVAFHASAPLLATGSNDNTVKMWHLVDMVDTATATATLTCVATLTGHSHSINSVAFHKILPLLATASRDSTAKLWK